MTRSMAKNIVVLDSNEFIFGLTGTEHYPKLLIDSLESAKLSNDFRIHSQILKEVLDNIPQHLHGDIFELFNSETIAFDEEPVSKDLWNKYKEMNLKKGDIIIAAYAEMIDTDILVSENRHFLKELKKANFEIMNAEQFLKEILKQTFK
ncbi:hypothetical protein HYS31_01420 [Candidatus Woesearchaeota archaeon]|nr:hypothetical protein [Candidatus Woesearchaeota archaeon]